MPFGLIDLSIVTDLLVTELNNVMDASVVWRQPPPATPSSDGEPFVITCSGLSPDAAREEDNCQVSLYLFHVAPDKFHRNTFPLPDRVGQGPTEREVAPRARTIPEQPLSLMLYYLLSVHSKGRPVQEQRAMGIALKWFHDHPIVRATGTIGGLFEDVTVTMEPQSVDEIGRLWQAISSPLRLSVVYRASVIFFSPEPPRKGAAEPVRAPDVKAYPQFAVTRAVVAPSGLATITGVGFAAGSIVVTIDNVKLQITTSDPPEQGRFRVVSPTRFDVQLVSGTQEGRHRLAVQRDRQQPPAVFTLEVKADVP